MVRKCEVPVNWPVEPGHYYLGNKFHPVAVMVPHVYNVDGSKCVLCAKLLDVARSCGVAIAGYCQTANIGIEKVVANVLANPNIRWLIIVGHESQHFSGKAIMSLIDHGVDPATRRILNCPEAKTGYLPNIPLEAIDRFRRQIKYVDLLLPDEESCISQDELREVRIGTELFKVPADVVEEDDKTVIRIRKLNSEVLPEVLRLVIHACIQEPENSVVVEIPGRYGTRRYMLYDPGAFDDKPYIVKLSLAEHYHEVVAHVDKDYGLVIADNFADEYNYLVKKIREVGRYVETHYGPTREILFTHIVVLDPEKLTVPITYPPRDLENIQEYCRAFVTGESPLETKELSPQLREAYSYGQRLRRWGEEIKLYILRSRDFEKFVEEIATKLGIEADKVRQIVEAFVDKFLIRDQLEIIIQHLIADPSSRQAVICLWNPAVDLVYVKSPPCFTHIQLFIRDNELHAALYIRSHDFQNAHIHNIAAIRELMLHIVEELRKRAPEKFGDLRLGKLHFIVGSNHVYEAHVYR